jgi:hypothetical protein
LEAILQPGVKAVIGPLEDVNGPLERAFDKKLRRIVHSCVLEIVVDGRSKGAFARQGGVENDPSAPLFDPVEQFPSRNWKMASDQGDGNAGSRGWQGRRCQFQADASVTQE